MVTPQDTAGRSRSPFLAQQRIHVRVGDRVFLVPTTRDAPAAAYSQPEVTVLAIRRGRAVVELADGRQVTTALANLRGSLPRLEQPGRRGRRAEVNR